MNKDPLYDYPTAGEIRAALLSRIDRYCRITGTMPYLLCREALNDGTWLARVNDGRGFTLKSYERIHAVMDRGLRAHMRRLAKQ